MFDDLTEKGMDDLRKKHPDVFILDEEEEDDAK